MPCCAAHTETVSGPCPALPSARRRIAAEKRGAFRLSFRPYVDRAALAGRAAIEQMAEDFQTFVANVGSISQDDLEVLGWTRAQIVLHAQDARERVNRRADG